MKVPIEVTPEEMLDLLSAIYHERKAYPSPSAEISDLVRACFLAGLAGWME